MNIEYHGLRTSREEIAFTARPKIHFHSQIFSYGWSIFCLPHRPNFSDLCLHWLSVVRVEYDQPMYFDSLMIPLHRNMQKKSNCTSNITAGHHWHFFPYKNPQNVCSHQLIYSDNILLPAILLRNGAWNLFWNNILTFMDLRFHKIQTCTRLVISYLLFWPALIWQFFLVKKNSAHCLLKAKWLMERTEHCNLAKKIVLLLNANFHPLCL